MKTDDQKHGRCFKPIFGAEPAKKESVGLRKENENRLDSELDAVVGGLTAAASEQCTEPPIR